MTCILVCTSVLRVQGKPQLKKGAAFCDRLAPIQPAANIICFLKSSLEEHSHEPGLERSPSVVLLGGQLNARRAVPASIMQFVFWLTPYIITFFYAPARSYFVHQFKLNYIHSSAHCCAACPRIITSLSLLVDRSATSCVPEPVESCPAEAM